MLPSEAHLRQAEMQALGWDEATVYGGPDGGQVPQPHARS
jgi:hypothetical protein